MAAREAWESGNDLLRMESDRAVAGSIVIARARYATPRRGADRRGHSLAGANISPSLSLPPVYCINYLVRSSCWAPKDFTVRFRTSIRQWRFYYPVSYTHLPLPTILRV